MPGYGGGPGSGDSGYGGGFSDSFGGSSYGGGRGGDPRQQAGWNDQDNPAFGGGGNSAYEQALAASRAQAAKEAAEREALSKALIDEAQSWDTGQKWAGGLGLVGGIPGLGFIPGQIARGKANDAYPGQEPIGFFEDIVQPDIFFGSPLEQQQERAAGEKPGIMSAALSSFTAPAENAVNAPMRSVAPTLPPSPFGDDRDDREGRGNPFAFDNPFETKTVESTAEEADKKNKELADLLLGRTGYTRAGQGAIYT